MHACMQEWHWCPEDDCECRYTQRKNLQRHLKSVHGKREDNGRFACQVEACGERFYHAKGLMQHYQDKHNIITSKYPHASYMITCMQPIHLQLDSFMQLNEQLYIMKLRFMCHIGFEMKNFCTWEEFVSWKESEEQSTHTYFVQPKGEEISHIQEKSKCQINLC